MITVSEEIEIPYPPDVVWEIISDPETVVQCVEGAELGESLGDGAYKVKTTVKFGPLRIRFSGQIKLELDHDALEGKLSLQGMDAQGGARFKSVSSFKVTERDAGTNAVITVTGDVEISGKLVSVIESGAGRVVRRQTDDFAKALLALCNEKAPKPGKQ